MNPKLKKTILCLRISSVFYFVLGTLIASLLLFFSKKMFGEHPTGDTLGGLITAIFMAILSLAMAIFVEFVIHGLKKTKYWAWIAGVILTAMYIPSLFIILGIIGILGLLDKSVMSDFQQARNQKA